MLWAAMGSKLIPSEHMAPFTLLLSVVVLLSPEAESAGLEEVVGDSEAWPELTPTRLQH